MPYCMYLRKSRKDFEAESAGQGETLARHKAALLETAQRLHLAVSEIYQEIVSGDSIAARPEMQRLLADVETGKWDGVLVMEVERLARGDTMDQGQVQRTFVYTGTKIITPTRTYDPSDPADAEYFEFGLFMSRREYQTINRRLLAGRERAVREGKWPQGHAPYGYRAVKVPKGKGYMLEIVPEEAEIVKSIFNWYVNGAEYNGAFLRVGARRISTMLNSMGLTTQAGNLWSAPAVRVILKNHAYIGKVTWYKQTLRKSMSNGAVVKKLERTPERTLICDGLHEAIISEELFEAAQARLSADSTGPATKGPLQSPLAGLLYCGLCGCVMARQHEKGKPAYYVCRNPLCRCRGSKLEVVEQRVVATLARWLAGYEITAKAQAQTVDIGALQSALDGAQRELLAYQQQQTRLYDLLERGIYTEQVFLQRQAAITGEVQRLQAAVADTEAAIAKAVRINASARDIVPAVHAVLDAYPTYTTAQEKNDALRMVLSRVEYTRTVGGFGSDPQDFEVKIFPRLPEPVE